MASERDRCPAHVDGIPDRLYLRKEPDAYDWVHDQAPGIEPDETEYIRSDLAEQREAELVEVLNLIVDRKWSIASPIHARPDNEDEATHLMCSIEKQAIDKARAILAKHKAEGREGS